MITGIMPEIKVVTRSRSEFIDITAQVREVVEKSGVNSGLCVLYVPHTTAGVAINESYDPDVARDIINTLEKLAPANARYQHTEGNADAHIKSTLVGNAQVIPVENGQLRLGRWQGIFLCEFDGPRTRTCIVKIIND